MSLRGIVASVHAWYEIRKRRYGRVVNYVRVLIEITLFVLIVFTGMKTFPLSIDNLYSIASRYHNLQGYRNRVQSILHGRFQEMCPVFNYEKFISTVSREKLEELKDRHAGYLSGIVEFIHFYNTASRESQYADCSDAWEYRDLSWWVAHQFQYSIPYAWLMEKFGLSEIFIALAVIVNAWIGLYCLYLITKRMTGSRVVGFFAVFFPHSLSLFYFWQ